MSLRLNRLASWIATNPYAVYADYNDTISDEQAAMLLDGKFDEFSEDMWEWEINASDYADWAEWESEFASAAGYDEWDGMPTWLQEWAQEQRVVDCSDLIEGAIGNWRGHVAALVLKRNGEPIEFQGAWGQEWDASAARYLKRYCGIDPRASEPTYAGTYMKAIGTVDLLAVWKAGKAPSQVRMHAGQMTIGHEALNGSGTCGDDQYRGASRWMKAQFSVDSLDRYGVDSVFGLTGSAWADYMDVR